MREKLSTLKAQLTHQGVSLERIPYTSQLAFKTGKKGMILFTTRIEDIFDRNGMYFEDDLP